MTKVVNPSDILKDVSPLSLPADSPPDVANYRDADMGGIACATCSKFMPTDSREEDGIWVPSGICDRWEAKVDGVKVCDNFATHGPAIDRDGKEVWSEFSNKDTIEAFDEIHCAGTAIEERNGKVVKGILRTGHWDVTPTPLGKIKKPLSIVKEGKSDPVAGVISLQEIIDNYKSGAVKRRVSIPLSDDAKNDHKNLTSLNTGFVEDLFLEEHDGEIHLMAEMGFTEPDVRDKALRGTYADVSSGIPHHSEHGAFLDHVCITNDPFIPGLQPWMEASNAPAAVQEAEVVHHILDEKKDEIIDEDPPEGRVKITFGDLLRGVSTAIEAKFGADGADYTMIDADDEKVTVKHTASGLTWTIPYSVVEDAVVLPDYTVWTIQEGSSTPEGEAEQHAPPPSTDEPVSTGEPELDAAREARSARLAASANHPSTTGDDHMTVISPADLDKLGLTEEQRRVFDQMHQENTTLTASNQDLTVKTRESEAELRVDELTKKGLTPGALKLYRTVYLSDDGGPAIVYFSDDGKGAKESKSALQILDDFIEASTVENTITFSDQHAQVPGDTPPPNKGDEGQTPEERAKAARDFLYPNGRK